MPRLWVQLGRAMNKKQYLLLLLAEEASEISHICSKCIRFGYDEQRFDYEPNIERLNKEYNDLLCIVNLLNRELGKKYLYLEKKLIEEKKEKVDKYYKLSKRYGTVE